MERSLVLIAGPPATGKSYLIREMRQVIPDFFLITPDEVKEMFADKKGFRNLAEKEQLEKEVWAFYYDILDRYMLAGKKVIVSEYPFSGKQKDQLSALAEKHAYQVITIRLIADFETLWQRRKERDLEPDRHLSHIVKSYHEGLVLSDNCLADNRITKEAFREIIAKRRYNDFELGLLKEIDVSDFAQVDYSELLHWLQNQI